MNAVPNNTIQLLDTLKARVQQRDFYLWGVRQNGLSMCRVMERMGLRPAGFIDSSKSMRGQKTLGYTVYAPDTILGAAGPKPFILITSGFFSDEISETCERAGYIHGEDFVVFSELQAFDYQIDVSGACNLRCISCPQGNFADKPAMGYMSLETYKQVLDKILREDPAVGVVALYNWGEPLLNRQLPEIIRYTNERGVHSAISSNLNVRKFDDVIRAKPTWFRVSVSGYGKNYEITHTGGKWDIFYRNLFRLRDLREAHHPDMIVEVFYHIYKHNRDDLPRVKALCDELGFSFRFRQAALAPLENIEAVIDGKELTPEAMKTMDLQGLKVPQAMAMAREKKDRICSYERYLWINWDLRVAQCMERYDPKLSLVPGDFLSTPLSSLIAARKDNAFCTSCKERAIHQCYIVYADEKLVGDSGAPSLQ